MLIRPLFSLAVASAMLLEGSSPQPKAVAAPDTSDGAAFTADKQLQFPAKYRE